MQARARCRVLGVVLMATATTFACCVKSEECQTETQIYAVVDAAPGFLDLASGDVRLCFLACRGDPSAAPACDAARGDTLGNCEVRSELPVQISAVWAWTDCPPPPPIPPGYLLAFHDLDEDRAVSPGEAYGVTAHGGAPSLETLELDVLIDRIAP